MNSTAMTSEHGARTLQPLHPDATGFTVFRALPDGSGRQYTAVEFTRGWAGADQFLRQLRACGFVRNSTTDTSGYAVLDVLDADDNIVQDYDLTTPQAFRYVYRKLRLRVVDPHHVPQSEGDASDTDRTNDPPPT